MIFTKLIYLLLSFNLNNKKTSYYKIIKYKNKIGCVEANTTLKIANVFNAKKGNCKCNNYTIFKGTYNLPFCCKVYGYEYNNRTI